MTLLKTMKELEVAIVGGGVCGLTCAVALAKEGVHVKLYEAAPSFREIGAGIGLGPNAIRILKELGVLDSILAKSDEPELKRRSFLFVSGMDGHETIFDYPTTPEDVGAGIHRAAFLDALVRHVDPAAVHFNKRCTHVAQSSDDSERPIIHFADGTRVEADVILGADGIKSAVRGAVTGHNSHIAYSNACVYRGLVPVVELRAAGARMENFTRPICFCGKGKHIIAFPIKGGQIINVAAFATNREIPIGAAALPPEESWVVPVSKDQAMQEFTGWGKDVTALLSCIHQPSKWFIPVVYPALGTYVKGRVALLGDAAHGMLPHLGAGAGQGLEDALLLACLLGHPQTNLSNVEIVLQIYDSVRRPRAQNVWNSSTAAGDVYDGYGKHGAGFEGMQEDLKGIWEGVWRYGLHQDLENALLHLKTAGTFAN